MEKRDSFIFYRSFYEALQDLNESQKVEIYDAISNYSLNFKENELKGVPSTIFKLIKPQLEANNKRFINGSKPKKSKTEAKQKQNRSKLKANNNVNDNVNKNDNVVLLEKESKSLLEEWIEFRKKIKKPIKLEKTKISLAKKIKNEGFEKSKSVIYYSIENEYQGLFWDRTTLKSQTPNHKPFVSKLEKKYK
jgi:hypothetical protein